MSQRALAIPASSSFVYGWKISSGGGPVMIVRSIRVGLGCAMVLVPFALAGACKEAETGDTPDGTAPIPTGTSETGSPEGSTDAGRTDGVLRELSYHQLTTKPEHGTAVKPAISGNGARVVWSTYPDDHISKVWVAETSGAEPVLVDTYPAASGSYAFVAISDDGNTIVSTNGASIRARGKDGSDKGEIVFGGEISNAIVNGTGTEVYFALRRNDALASNPGVSIERGIYKWTPGTQNFAPLITASDVAALAATTEDHVFPFSGCGGSGPGYTALVSSADGSKIYAITQIDDAMLVVQTSNTGAAGAKIIVPAVTESYKFVNAIATSADGSKLAFSVSNTSPEGAALEIIGADGAGRKKVADIGGGCGNPLSLSADGKVIGDGRRGVLHPVDGSDRIPVISTTGATGSPFYFVGEPSGFESEAFVMSNDGKRFAYVNKEVGGNSPVHLAVAELDSSALGTVPTVSAPKVSRASIPRDNTTKASLSAKVAGASPFVGATFFTKGVLENTGVSSANYPLYDDGKNLDTAGGDGTFTSTESVFAGATAVAGPRVLRIKAEVKDASGKRQGHAVDFGPFAVE